MERQRNKPLKYNRELVHKSVKAMQKVEEVCKLHGQINFCYKTTTVSSTFDMCYLQIHLSLLTLWSALKQEHVAATLLLYQCRFVWLARIVSMKLA